MVYLICALILLGIYIFTYRNIGNTISDARSERCKLFNRSSSLFYQMLTFSPLVALYEPLMRMGFITNEIDKGYVKWTADTTISLCIILGLWIWYFVATRKLKTVLYWVGPNTEEYLRSLQKQVKRYFIINAIISGLQTISLVFVSLCNYTYYFLPYTWWIVVLLIAINVYLFMEYPKQRILLGMGTVREKIQSINSTNQKIEKTAVIDEKPESKPTKRCPYCGEEILAVAKKCKHCGEWLNND